MSRINMKLAFLLLLCLVVLVLVRFMMVKKVSHPPMTKATLTEVQDVINNFPPLLKAEDFMKFHFTSHDENEVGYLSTTITERATKSYKDHVKKIIFFPPIDTDDEIIARDQMDELRESIDAALNAHLKIDKSMIWARPLSATVTKWSETENPAKDSALALFQSIQRLEDK